MSVYYRTPKMVEGTPFKCFNCNKTLAIRVQGSAYELDMVCPRCKTEIKIKCHEIVPFKTSSEELLKTLVRDMCESFGKEEVEKCLRT